MPEEGIAGGAGNPQGSAPTGGSSAPGGLDWSVFKSSLGDLGKDKSFEPIKDFHGLAKSYVEAQKMIGGSIRLPKKDASPEEKKKAQNDILTKLRAEGILEAPPQAPDKYEIKLPKEEGFTPNEPLINSFKEAAHKSGLPPSQAQAMVDWYLNFQAETERQEQMEFENTKKALKSEFGGLYVRKMEAARRAASKYLGEDGDELISNLPPKTGARILKALAEIGDPLLEDAMVAGEIPGVVTKDEIQNKINIMITDKKHPLNDISHPGHKAAVEEYSRLQQDLIRLTRGRS
jgi:hypothetical protein